MLPLLLLLLLQQSFPPSLLLPLRNPGCYSLCNMDTKDTAETHADQASGGQGDQSPPKSPTKVKQDLVDPFDGGMDPFESSPQGTPLGDPFALEPNTDVKAKAKHGTEQATGTQHIFPPGPGAKLKVPYTQGLPMPQGGTQPMGPVHNMPPSTYVPPEVFWTEHFKRLEMLEQAYKDQQSLLQGKDTTPAITVYNPQEPRKLKLFWGNEISDPRYQDVEEWLKELDAHLASLKDRTVLEKVQFVMDHLEGSAKGEVRYRPEEERNTVSLIKNILKDVFKDRRSLATRQEDFYTYRQSKDESLRDFSHGLLRRFRAVSKLVPTMEATKDSVLTVQFSEHVFDTNLRRELRRLLREKSDISFIKMREEAIMWAGDEDLVPPTTTTSKSSKSSAQSKSITTQSTSAEVSVTSSSTDSQPCASAAQDSLLQKLQDQLKSLQKGQNTLAQKLKALSSTSGSNDKSTSDAATSTQASGDKPKRDWSNYTCELCGYNGHSRKRCPKNPKCEYPIYPKDWDPNNCPKDKATNNTTPGTGQENE